MSGAGTPYSTWGIRADGESCQHEIALLQARPSLLPWHTEFTKSDGQANHGLYLLVHMFQILCNEKSQKGFAVPASACVRGSAAVDLSAAFHSSQWMACLVAMQRKEKSCVPSGEPGKGKKRVWMIARQHPGESMAEWFVEGEHAPSLCIGCQTAAVIISMLLTWLDQSWHRALHCTVACIPNMALSTPQQALQHYNSQHIPKLLLRLRSLILCCRNTALANMLPSFC